MVDKLILEALKEALGEDKFQELMRNLTSLGTTAADAIFEAAQVARKRLNLGNFVYENVYYASCYDPDGNLKWEDEAHNLVVDVGLVHTLDVVMNSGSPDNAQTTTWYLGLLDAYVSPGFVYDDTLATLPWTEFTEYSSPANRATLDFSATASASAPGASIAASQVSFTIASPGGTCGGAFICDAASGTSGLLYGGAAFTGGDKSGLGSGDTLNVDVTLNASST